MQAAGEPPVLMRIDIRAWPRRAQPATSCSTACTRHELPSWDLVHAHTPGSASRTTTLALLSRKLRRPQECTRALSLRAPGSSHRIRPFAFPGPSRSATPTTSEAFWPHRNSWLT